MTFFDNRTWGLIIPNVHNSFSGVYTYCRLINSFAEGEDVIKVRHIVASDWLVTCGLWG